MVSVHDVAKYIVERLKPISTMKLQKLVYYSQAWSLVWDERPLFDERIEAWANGPVVPALYDMHRGRFQVDAWPAGNLDNLDQVAIETIESVLNFYGKESAQWLSDLSHSEAPWIEARKGFRDGDSCKNEITTGAMADYYSGL